MTHAFKQKITPSASEIIPCQTNVVTTTLAVPPVEHAQRKKTSQQTAPTDPRDDSDSVLLFSLSLLLLFRLPCAADFCEESLGGKSTFSFLEKKTPPIKPTSAMLARTVSQHTNTKFT